jgi:protein involved in polysaccharide export with SLBB domain
MRHLTLLYISMMMILYVAVGISYAKVDTRLLQSGDRIRVTVLNEPDITKESIIDKDGVIQLALLGDIKLSGMSTYDAATAIKELLADYIIQPAVSVELLESGKLRVFVVGEVQKPGIYTLDRGAKALEAITSAEYTDNSDLAKVTIHRGSQIIDLDLTVFLTGNDLTTNVSLEPDDTIVVARRDLGRSVLVLGEVTRPGATSFISGMTIKELIAACGGMKPEADISKITIRHDGSQEVIPIDFTAAGETSGNTIILAGDTIMIPRSDIAYFIVEGGVNQPGRYCLKTGMTIEDALASAGGLTKDAKIDSIQIVRTVGNARSAQIVNLKSIRVGGCPIVYIQPQDIIVVPVRKPKPSTLEVLSAIGAIGWIFIR